MFRGGSRPFPLWERPASLTPGFPIAAPKTNFRQRRRSHLGNNLADAAALAERLRASVGRVVYGAEAAVDLLLVALVAGGHILMEDVPGTGKTRLALALARSLGLEFRRIQCTPDLLPGDVLGSLVFSEPVADFVFRPGPIFANVVLADEINRTTPRTQSAFLEAMQEGAVSVDGVTRSLPAPFLLIATQNPIDFEGTFPLPEAQLDRFLLRVPMPYPGRDQERRMVLDFGRTDDPALAALTPTAGAGDLARLRQAADAAVLTDEVAGYIVDVVRATREDDALRLAASPRSAIALTRAARARAVLAGRSYVTPDDVKALALPVLGHRLVLNREAELRGDTADAAVRRAVDRTPIPAEASTPRGRS